MKTNDGAKPCDSSSNKLTIDYDIDWLRGTSAEKVLDNNAKKKKKAEKSSSLNNKPFSDPIYSKISRLNGKVNKMSLDDLADSLNELNLDKT
jgi:hypothetical protein